MVDCAGHLHSAEFVFVPLEGSIIRKHSIACQFRIVNWRMGMHEYPLFDRIELRECISNKMNNYMDTSLVSTHTLLISKTLMQNWWRNYKTKSQIFLLPCWRGWFLDPCDTQRLLLSSRPYWYKQRRSHFCLDDCSSSFKLFAQETVEVWVHDAALLNWKIDLSISNL